MVFTNFNNQALIENQFRDFIIKEKHPCIMAKTVFSMDMYTIKAYNTLNNEQVAKQLLHDLENYIDNYDFESKEFESFIACFPNDHFDNEIDFENALWKFLNRLHELDDKPWDPTVSSDPESPSFSFSIKGKAFYIVGLHPKSSRMARQSPYVTIVFNLHKQFEMLREMGTFSRVKKRIRKRDQKLQGSINPVLKDFGKESETKQYSGRQVNEDWKCPFKSNTNYYEIHQ